MKFSKTVSVLFGVAVLASAGVAQAEDKLQLTTVVQKEQKVINADGETTVQLVPVESIVPGEEVVYTVTYTNVSDASTENIVITNPIPEQLTYVDGSAFGPGTEITFSIDGGDTYAVAESLIVVENDVERRATAKDFTNVRWELQNSLNAGEQGFARFRARLN